MDIFVFLHEVVVVVRLCPEHVYLVLVGLLDRNVFSVLSASFGLPPAFFLSGVFGTYVCFIWFFLVDAGGFGGMLSRDALLTHAAMCNGDTRTCLLCDRGFENLKRVRR